MVPRLIVGLLTAAALACGAPALAQAESSYAFADWSDVTAGVAHGTLNGGSVSFSGTQVDSPPAGTVTNDSPQWDRPDFTPPLSQSDAISFVGGTGHAYELDFGAPQTDPLLDFGSLASTLTFPAGTQIDRLSGDQQFSVSGNQVIGAFEGPTDDGNGTVRLHGTFTSIPFTADFFATDGIYVQVGVALPPDTTITSGPTGSIWNSITQFTFTSTLAGSTFECQLDGASFTACDSPYITQSLSSGPHTFSVRAISADGVADPTPATQAFEIKQPETLQQPACVVMPVYYWLFDPRFFAGERSMDSDRWACVVEEHNAACPQYHNCTWITDRCPVGAVCTLTTRAEWSDQDTNINHGAYAAAVLGGPPFQEIVQSGYGPYASGRYAGWQDARCGVHGGHQCTATATDVALGDDSRVFGGCAWAPGTIPIAESVGAVTLGPDTRRTLTCFVSLHIEPAAAFAPVQDVGPYVTIYAPTSGTLKYHPDPVPAFAAVARQRPAIAPVTTNVSEPGPVKVKLRLNAAAKRLLARRHKLPVTLEMTFSPTVGAAVMRTTRITLRSAPKPPKRCAAHKPSRNLRRLQKACHLWRHA